VSGLPRSKSATAGPSPIGSGPGAVWRTLTDISRGASASNSSPRLSRRGFGRLAGRRLVSGGSGMSLCTQRSRVEVRASLGRGVAPVAALCSAAGGGGGDALSSFLRLVRLKVRSGCGGGCGVSALAGRGGAAGGARAAARRRGSSSRLCTRRLWRLRMRASDAPSSPDSESDGTPERGARRRADVRARAARRFQGAYLDTSESDWVSESEVTEWVAGRTVDGTGGRSGRPELFSADMGPLAGVWVWRGTGTARRQA
jgi:hypothetical protein